MSRDSQDRAAGQPPASFLPTADDFLSEDDPTAKAVFLVLERVRTVLDRTPVDRDSYVVALLSIVELVKLFLGAETAVKLLRLPMALADLNSGRVAEFLESGRKSQGDASEIWAQRVYVALALECLMRCGQKKDEAAKEIARSAHLDGLITERRNLKSPWQDVITWRDNLKADRVRNPVAQSMFSDGLVTIEDFEASELVELAQGFLREAKLFAG